MTVEGRHILPRGWGWTALSVAAGIEFVPTWMVLAVLIAGIATITAAAIRAMADDATNTNRATARKGL